MRIAGVIFVCFVCAVFATGAGSAGAQDSRVEEVFSKEVQPILAAHCVKCHGAEKQESGLRLDHGLAILRGGDSGPAVVARDPDRSLLMQTILGKSDTVSRMPLKAEALTDQDVGVLRRWIEAGAVVPRASVAEQKKSSHWAFQPVARPSLPSVKSAGFVRNPIDAFIAAKLEEEGLATSVEAGPATLVRRVWLDLVGLPPPVETIDAYESDVRPDAYERQVDRLLASPHYGERWGRHWLDLARYADSNGYTRDFGRQIWKYREWVIDAINRNLPFDRFTIEQLAGDMLPGASEGQLVATGFHRNTLINEEGGTDQEQFRIEAVIDRVSTTGSVWLGLTVGCARCHSHKYDPISQVEFYQLFALLNNCDEPTIEVPTRRQHELGEMARREAIREEIKRLDEQVEQQRAGLEAEQREWEATVTPEQRARLPGPVQVAFDMKFDARDDKNKKTIEEYFRRSDTALQVFPVLARIHELKESEPKIPTTMILRERQAPRESFVHRRGDFLDRGADVSGGVPGVLPPLVPRGERADRLDFARWLVSSENPLTPRVAMNRDWQKFFGRGLVETEDDFGLQGTPASHPELLEWLGAEFSMGPKFKVQSPRSKVQGPKSESSWDFAWDVKRMHRTIVTSATYRQSSAVRSDLAARDPQNRLLGRQSRLRLDAEVVRDVTLAAAGLLMPTLGGPSVFPPQPDGVFDFTQDPKPWIAATGSDRYRRGMYTHFWRSSPFPMLLTFDAPGGNVSCTRRLRSNTPLQSLTLANDEAFFEAARELAQYVQRSMDGDIERAELAFRRCVSRRPTAAEQQAMDQLVQHEYAASPNDRGTAWTRICRVLLNLDETITRE